MEYIDIDLNKFLEFKDTFFATHTGDYIVNLLDDEKELKTHENYLKFNEYQLYNKIRVYMQLILRTSPNEIGRVMDLEKSIAHCLYALESKIDNKVEYFCSLV